jgi:hypothetical protein
MTHKVPRKGGCAATGRSYNKEIRETFWAGHRSGSIDGLSGSGGLIFANNSGAHHTSRFPEKAGRFCINDKESEIICNTMQSLSANNTNR